MKINIQILRRNVAWLSFATEEKKKNPFLHTFVFVKERTNESSEIHYV